MSTMNISLPDALKAFVDRQVEQGQYGTSSEYLRELIRRDQSRLAFRQLILDGMASKPLKAADAGYWDAKRRRLARKA